MASSLFDRAARAIDTSWFSSGYWEHRHGHFTLPGVRKALGDCRARMSQVEDSRRRLQTVLVELNAEEKKLERWAVDDEGEE